MTKPDDCRWVFLKVKILLVMLSFFSMVCVWGQPKSLGAEENLLYALKNLRMDRSSKNTQRFFAALDSWGYPNYFEFKTSDLKEARVEIICILEKYALAGNPYAIRSMVRSARMCATDAYPAEYSEMLGEDLYLIGKKHLGQILESLVPLDKKAQEYVLLQLRYALQGEQVGEYESKAFTNQLKRKKLRKKFPQYISFIENSREDGASH
jgi:hypothetical protein